MLQYPENRVSIMRGQMNQIRRTIAHHFARRHDGRGKQPARNWIAEYRRLDNASGYSAALSQIKGN